MKIEFFQESRRKYYSFHDLMQDLNLRVILNYMTGVRKGDIPFIQEVMFHPVDSFEEMERRNTLIKGCCDNPDIVEELYGILEEVQRNYEQRLEVIRGGKGNEAGRAAMVPIFVELLQWFARGIYRIHQCMEEHGEFFDTYLHAFREQFYAEMPKERILELVHFSENLDAFKRQGEMCIKMSMGEGMKLADISISGVKERADKRVGGVFRREKDAEIFRDADLYENGISLSNNIIYSFMEQRMEFWQGWLETWRTLRRQVTFLFGCVTLYGRGKERDFYFTYPDLEKCRAGVQEQAGVYELSLAFQSSQFPVPNDINLTGRQVLLVTGANQGGKSTFLRSLGIAQVMFQCGMFIPAKEYASRLYRQIFTHFTRREDAAMNTGRFEEELGRMEQILLHIEYPSVILLNESFASTTEITAAGIASALDRGIAGKEIDLWTVTHITKYALEMYGEKDERHLFLSAGREANGETRFEMVEKRPDNTSFGMELFEQMLVSENC